MNESRILNILLLRPDPKKNPETIKPNKGNIIMAKNIL